MNAMGGVASYGLCIYKPSSVPKAEVVSPGCWRREGGKVKGLRVRSGVGKVNGRKVNGVVNKPIPGIDKEGDDEFLKNFKLGRLVEKRLVYRQTSVIRSDEIGPDKTATMETLMNLLQVSGVFLFVTRINIQVDKYSRWGDVIEIDTWVAASGKNGMRRDWIIRDYSTRKTITRATSTWVIMNRETRKLSKIPEQVRGEVKPFSLDRKILPQDRGDKKIDKLSEETAGHIRSGLAPRWSDMDVNQHVNNVKYIGWILESVPLNILEDYHLASITLEYRRECRQSNLLESLTTMEKREADEKFPSKSSCKEDLGSIHLLCLQEDKAEIVRARAEWRAKHT